MIADVAPPGCCAIVNVSGSRIATPFAPPRPGNTPISTPNVTPANMRARLNHVIAMAKPPIRDWISCMRAPGQPKPRAASMGPLGRGTLNQISNRKKKKTTTPRQTGTVFSSP